MIPETFKGSWYESEVFVGSKDAMFEPSFALQYVTEHHSICMRDIEYLNIYLSPNCYVHVLYYFKTWICTLLEVFVGRCSEYSLRLKARCTHFKWVYEGI